MKIYGVLLLFLIALPLASAEIIFSQPQQFYSFGDTLESTVTLKESSPMSDFFTVDLICSNSSVSLYRNTISFKADETKQVNLNTPLTPKVVSDLHGNCYLLGKFADEEARSIDFVISRAIDVNANLKTTTYNPEDLLMVSGTAIKTNGKNVSGYAEIVLDHANISTKTIIINGVLNLNITLPKDYAAGAHVITIKVYEKDNLGQITNEGNITKEITVAQVLSSFEVSVDKENVKPGDELIYTVGAFDQTGLPLERSVSLSVHDPNRKTITRETVKTNVERGIAVNSSFAPGYWEIEASTEGFDMKKLFYVEAYQDAQFDIVNNTLILTNIGNVPYEKQISVEIGEVSFVKDVQIKVGGLKRFNLQGEGGSYDVRVDDGQHTFERSSVQLTGNAIRLKEAGSLGVLNSKLVWIILVSLVALALITNVYIKYRRNNGMITRKMSSIIPAKSGAREVANVLALRVAHGPTSERTVNSALETLQNAGAKVYADGAYRIAVFSKSLTGHDNNEFLALKVLEEVMDKFNDHNIRMKDKIEYGVGLNKGELISESKKGKFSFTAIGALIPTTKRIAQSSNKEVLMSNDFYKTVMGSVKADKDNKREAWVLNRVVDRSKHDGFIKGFLGRYNKDQ